MKPIFLALVAAMLGAVVLRYRTPAPRPADAPVEEFSAGRAREILRALVGDGRPHPAGSAAAARIRLRIVAGLENLGYRTQMQEAFACGSVRICTRIVNVLARLDGQREELELAGPEPVEAYVWDVSSGLPDEGAQLLSARPRWAVPFQGGDRTLVTSKARL